MTHADLEKSDVIGAGSMLYHANIPCLFFLVVMFGCAVPLCRRAIWPWREGLLGLAERLERPGPINPCGVARVLELLTDGTGPLYNPRAARSMGEAVWRIADGLQPRDKPALRRPA